MENYINFDKRIKHKFYGYLYTKAVHAKTVIVCFKNGEVLNFDNVPIAFRIKEKVLFRNYVIAPYWNFKRAIKNRVIDFLGLDDYGQVLSVIKSGDVLLSTANIYDPEWCGIAFARFKNR